MIRPTCAGIDVKQPEPARFIAGQAGRFQTKREKSL